MTFKHFLASSFLFIIVPHLIAQENPILFPAEAVVNVLDYGTNINDGVTDATEAIQKAIDENSGDIATRFTLYFPAGTYLITKPVGVDPYKEGGGGNGKGIILQGAGKNFTTFKLTDNNPLYQDSNNPLPVLTNAGRETSASWNNIAFMNSCFDFTIDIGQGNPGAAGLRYIANNQGSVYNVVIRTSDPNLAGWAGLDMERATISGPALIENVEIIGFDWGVRVGGFNYGTTLEHITIRNSTKGGIQSNGHIVNARKLKIENVGGPAFNNLHTDAFLTIIDSELDGQGEAAINNEGFLFARNITSSGFTHTLKDSKNGANTTIDGKLEEYVAGEKIRLYDDAATKSLNLGNGNVPETPELAWADTTTWVNVTKYGGGYTPGTTDNPNYSNASNAIQAAIDFMNEPGNEKYTTLFFPKGDYRIGTPIRIYGNVQRVVGNFAGIATQPDLEKQPEAIFTLDPTNFDELFIERINTVPMCCNDRRRINPMFLNNHQGDVVLKNVYIGHGKAYEKGATTGRLFMEDVCALSQYYYIHTSREEVLPESQPQFEFKDQEVWARQFNPEQRHIKADINGGQLWVLGIKTEEPGPVINARNNAQVEVLGGTILPSFPVEDGEPIIRMENSQGSFSFTEHVGFNNFQHGGYYRHILEERKGSDKKSLMREDSQKRGEERGLPVSAVPLYLAHGGAQVEPTFQLEILPAEGLEFGLVELEEQMSQSFTIRNIGTASVEISSFETSAPFFTSSEKIIIAPGAEVNQNVIFAPTVEGNAVGEIKIHSNTENNPNIISLNGEGFIAPTRIIRLSGALVFPDTEIGSKNNKTLVVHNDGNAVLTINDIKIMEGYTAEPTSFTLNSNASKEVVVTFMPTEADRYFGVVQVVSDATSGTSTTNVAGIGFGEVLSIGNEKDIRGLEVFPNPTTSELFLKNSEKGINSLVLKFYNSNGENVLERAFASVGIDKQNTINLSTLSKGLYLLHISIDGRIFFRKLLIQ